MTRYGIVVTALFGKTSIKVLLTRDGETFNFSFLTIRGWMKFIGIPVVQEGLDCGLFELNVQHW
jgi:hypothetical protein